VYRTPAAADDNRDFENIAFREMLHLNANSHLDLRRVCRGLADKFGLATMCTHTEAQMGDATNATMWFEFGLPPDFTGGHAAGRTRAGLNHMLCGLGAFRRACCADFAVFADVFEADCEAFRDA